MLWNGIGNFVLTGGNGRDRFVAAVEKGEQKNE